MVLSPNGIAREHKAQVKIVGGMVINFETPIKTRGIIISLIAEIKYILKLVKVFLRKIFATAIPVISIATGDIQSPETVMTDVINEGSFSPEIPMSIPIIIAINIGLKNAFILSLNDCLPESEIRSTGTPHKYMRIHKGSVKIKYSKKILGNIPLTTAFPINPKLEKVNP